MLVRFSKPCQLRAKGEGGVYKIAQNILKGKTRLLFNRRVVKNYAEKLAAANSQFTNAQNPPRYLGRRLR